MPSKRWHKIGKVMHAGIFGSAEKIEYHVWQDGYGLLQIAPAGKELQNENGGYPDLEGMLGTRGITLAEFTADVPETD